MAIYHEDIATIELNNGIIHRSFLGNTIGSGDNLANRFGVRTMRNGQPENIGGECFGLFIRPDGATVTINPGTVIGNVAYVELPEACYAVEGQFTLAIKCVGGGATGTLRIVDGVVSRTSTEAVVDPGTIIPSIDDLIEAINEAVASIPPDYTDLWEKVEETDESLAVFASGNEIQNPITKKAAIINASTGVITLNDAGVLYVYKVQKNTQFAAYFKGGNVHRIAVSNSPFAAGIETTVLFTNSSASELANQNTTFNTGENEYVYIQTAASASYIGTVELVQNSAYAKTKIQNAKAENNAKNLDGKAGIVIPLEFSQGAFTSSQEYVASLTDVSTDYFNGGVYLLNPDGFSIAIMVFNSEKEYVRYFAADEPATSPSGSFFKDRVIHLPRLYSGYYRIRVAGYNDAEGQRVVFMSNDCTVVVCEEEKILYNVGAVSTSGYSGGFVNIFTEPIKIEKDQTLKIELIDDEYQFAVYAISQSGSISLLKGYSGEKCEYYDDTVSYVIRIANVATSPSVFVNDGEDFYAAVSITKGKKIGYEREFNDITYSLNVQRKAISNGTIIDSTTCLMIELPRSGNVEVKLNAPSAEFCIYSYDGSSYTLVRDWKYYGFRYFGNGDVQYFAFVRNHPNATTITRPYKVFKVLTYYDSTDYKAINSLLYNKTIAVMGDSIVQGRFDNMSTSVTDALVKPWSELLNETTHARKDVDNYGLGGACVYDTDWRSLYNNRDKISGYDIVFVCAGTNDVGQNVTKANFKAAYQAVIDTLKANNTTVVLITPTSRVTETQNSVGLVLADYAGFVKELAEANNLTVLDLYAYTKNHAQFKESLIDGLHPDALGHRIIADYVINEYKG